MDDDAALRERFAEEIPVVLVDGVQRDFWKIDEARLTRTLQRAWLGQPSDARRLLCCVTRGGSRVGSTTRRNGADSDFAGFISPRLCPGEPGLPPNRFRPLPWPG